MYESDQSGFGYFAEFRAPRVLRGVRQEARPADEAAHRQHDRRRRRRSGGSKGKLH